MKLVLALVSLSVCLSIHLAYANWAPCLPAEFIDGYSVFLKRHLPSDTPSTLNHEDWEVYLKQHTDCDKSLQSFLSPDDRNGIEDICRPHAGKQQSGNYCISKNNFTFISVHSELGTCIIRNVTMVTQHVIVACDMVDQFCRPTHLEENRKGLVPRQEDPDCARAETVMMDHGFIMRAAGQLCLLLSILALGLCYLMG
ncbi:uncharacterized protein ACJ7VT_020940 isoform 1-T2 [Polymixia lowei]